jgi:hypothetical protein
MTRGAFIVVAAAFSIAACSGESVTGLDQMLYNATYSGPVTFQRSPIDAGIGAAQPSTVAMKLSQLGRDFTGTFTVADSSGRSVYSGSVMGRTTTSGADFTFVIPPECPGVLHGSFTVSNGELAGSATGRDCGATGDGDNVQITFTNLVRQ